MTIVPRRREALLRLCVFVLALAPSLLRAQDDSTYEIISHRYHLDLFPTEQALRCTDTLGLRARTGGGRFALRLFPVYRVSDVRAGGRKVEFTVSDDRLLLSGLPRDSVVDVAVEYAGRLPVATEFTQISADRAVFHEDGVLPHGLSAVRFVRGAITVPRPWEAIAVGALIEKQESKDSTTYVWEFDQPVPSLGWICAGAFDRRDLAFGSTALSTYLLPEDSASSGPLLEKMKDVLTQYNGWFTPYRFPKLALVEVDNAVAGRNVLAVAAPSFILVKKIAFETKDAFNRAEAILPHEIAHQWWPATVFIDDADAAFLSEGLCEYSALLYAEASGTRTSRDSLGHHPLLRSLLARVARGEDQPLQQKADLRAIPTQYLKASYVHNMLRSIMGDSLFRRLYPEYARRYALGKATLANFQSTAEALYGRPLGWFFRQWVERSGIPRLKIYRVAAEPSGTGWITRGRVRMVGYEKYTVYLRVGVETAGASAGTALWIGTDSAGTYRNDVPFEIRSAEKPLRALLDPGGDLLKVQKIAVKFGELRDPADGVMIVGTVQNRGHLLALARHDSAAMEESGWSISVKTDSAVTLADLQRERVFLYGTSAENSVAAGLAAKFPMKCDGDSAVVEGETVRDSTLALLQAVENPYRSSGMLCWIAPLSAAARPELLPYDFSWVLARGTDLVAHGSWETTDEDIVVDLSGSPKR